jgi:hypothetical protein
MSLYPSKASVVEAKFGRSFPAGYTPKALDSAAAMKARAIAALDAGKAAPEAVSIALAGSDEVPVVQDLIDKLLAERETLDAVPLDVEAKYLAAISAKAVLLDAATWVARKKAAVGELAPVAVEPTKL